MLPNALRDKRLKHSDAGFEASLYESHDILLQTWQKEEPLLADWLRHHDDSSNECRAELWTVYDDSKLVATARLTVHPELADVPSGYLAQGLEGFFLAPVASFNRLAVMPDYQGNGIGRHLDEARLKRARQLGAQSAISVCRSYRVSMLCKLGFEMLREDIPGVEMPSIKWSILCCQLRAS